MEGKKVAKRMGKRSNFFKRPDKSFTENRRALSGSKTNTTKIDLDHILVEASNHSDGEAEDVEMM